MSFDSILDSARKAAEIIQRVADKLKITTLPKDFPDQIVQLNNCLDVYSASKTMIAAVVSDARGGFNVESMAKLTANFDTNWDAFAKEYNELFNKSTAEQQTNVLETFARTHFGDNVFTAGSIIKNETPAILGGIVTFKAGINSFKGSYRNPEEAVNKIKTGIDSITAATEKIAGSLNNIAKTIQGGDGATGVALLEKLSKLHEIKLLNVTSNALGVAQHGMAAYGSGKAALGSSMAALGDVKDLLGDIKKGDLKGAISSGKATVDSVKDAIDDVKDTIKSGKKTIESAKATLSGLKGNVSDGQLTGAAANISSTSGASRMAGSRGSAATSRSADTANQGGQDKQDESGKSDSYVCSGAIMQCTFGDRKAKLTVYPDRTVFLTGQPMANISDHQSMYNIAGFGKCHTTRYPSTGQATAANHGKLTPMPCVPGTNTEWQNGKDDYIIKGDAALLKSSYCKCRWGGIITITDDGQHGEGTQWVSKESKVNFMMEILNKNKTINALLGTETTYKPKTKKEENEYKKNAGKILQKIANLSEEQQGRLQTQLYEMPDTMSNLQKLAVVENNFQIEKALGITKGERMTTETADKQSANPNYSYKYIADPNGSELVQGVRARLNPDYDVQYSINCATCAAVYALRRLGFDLTAKGNLPNTMNEWLSESHSFDIWKNMDGTKAEPTLLKDWMEEHKIVSMTGDDYKNYFEQVCKDEGIYVVTVKWKDEETIGKDGKKVKTNTGGHATILQRDSDGKLYYLEPQVYDSSKGEDGRRSIDDLIYSSDGELKLAPYPLNKGIMRIDDKLFNTDYAALFEV